MKRAARVVGLLVLSLLAGCSDPPAATGTSPGETPGSGDDLHPSGDIEIRRSTDGLERTIAISIDWLGDRFSDPKLVCEASSIERLLLLLAGKIDPPVDRIDGASNLPQGSYLHSFGTRTWKDEDAIFRDVVKATEDAFGLEIAITGSGVTRALDIKRN